MFVLGQGFYTTPTTKSGFGSLRLHAMPFLPPYGPLIMDDTISTTL